MKFYKLSSLLLSAVTLLTLTPAYAGMPDFARLADPTAACKDIKVGDNTQMAKNSSEDTYKRHDIESITDTDDVKNTSDSSHKDTEKTSGGINFGPIGGNGSHEESHEGTLKTDNSYKTDNSVKTDESLETMNKKNREESSSRVVQGKDCDRVIESVGKVETNKEDNETARYIADKKAEVEQEKARAEVMKKMLSW